MLKKPDAQQHPACRSFADFMYGLHQLFAKTDGVALREEDDSVKGVGYDGKYKVA